MTKKIGLLTWHYYSNVGSNLQAFAIAESVKALGFDCEFINYRKRELDAEYGWRRIVKSICVPMGRLLPKRFRFETYQFQRKYLPQGPVFYDRNQFSSRCQKYDAIVCGSDQIWAPNVFDPLYLLAYAPEKTERLSYAASIGLPSIPDELQLQYREYLSKYKVIGVREEQAKRYLESQLGIVSTAVLDPTFLISKQRWLEVADRSAPESDVFCYFLGDADRYKAAVDKASKKYGSRIVVYEPAGKAACYSDAEFITRMGPSEFLGRVANAKVLLTDSFHGIALSINLERDFVAFMRFAHDDQVNQNSRVINVLEKAGLEDRLFDGESLPDLPVDYPCVNDRLQPEIERSRAFLKAALKGVRVDA